MNPHLMSGLVLFGLTAAWYGALGHRRFHAITAHQAAVAEAYARAERVNAEVAGMPDLEAASARLQQWAELLQPHLQRDPAQPSLLLAAQNTLKGRGLQIERVENLTADASIGRANARIQATVSGPLSQLFGAIVDLENASPPTRVTDLTWNRQGADGGFRCEMTVIQVWQDAP